MTLDATPSSKRSRRHCSGGNSGTMKEKVEPAAKEQSAEEPTIPRDAGKHIAKYLVRQSGEIETDKIETTAITNCWEKNTRLSLRMMDFGARHTARLGDDEQAGTWLPVEILLAISNKLDPADKVCLALTCRHLFSLLDYQLADLRNVEKAMTYTGNFMPKYKQLASALNVQRVLVTERTDWSNYQKLIPAESNTMLACASCLMLHPRDLFSAAERQTAPLSRICRAAAAPFALREDTLSYVQLKKYRQDFLVENTTSQPPSGWDTISSECSHNTEPTHEHDKTLCLSLQIGRETSKIRWFRDLVPWEPGMIRRLPGTNRREMSISAIVAVLKRLQLSKQLGKVCAHMDVEAQEASKALAGANDVDEPMEHKCEECGMGWYFKWRKWTDQQSGWTSIGGKLQLVMMRPLKWVADPWCEEWLQHVEGGEGLSKKFEQVTGRPLGNGEWQKCAS